MTESASPMSAGALLPAPFVPSRPVWRTARFWFALAIGGLLIWQWGATQAQLSEARQELTQRTAESEKRLREAEKRLVRAIEETSALARKYDTLATRQENFQGETDALRQILQETASGSDDMLIAEAEQYLNFAIQQLQLAGNAQAAILTLTSLDNRLARAGRPLFLSLRRTLARELERLRATPFVDVPGISLRLENIIAGIDKLPLAMTFTGHPAEKPAVTTQPPVSWWRQVMRESWRELKGMARIQRFDRQEPVLLSPDQALILRENLKLRLLNARLALLSRDQWTFRNELRITRQWLRQYFNVSAKPVEAALSALQQLAATELAAEPPTLNDSLVALQTLKANREKR
ncbi:MAG: uroporphyrinogen-III C-methyltransferase [Zoogloeaceae bacterium]|jgi:uroporphyrin-3 C-methyltransferase|nr:uroporphyrinogen-III C-methyltransferase [Zoogloeaceae bacterium]